MSSAKLLEANVLESFPFERRFHQTVGLRGSHRIVRAATQPDRHVQKIASRVIGLVSLAEPVFVDPAEEESANADGTASRQHCTEDPASFRAARETGERQRPARRLRPLFAEHFESGAKQAEAPLGRINPWTDCGVRSEHDPSLRGRGSTIPFSVHRAGPIEIARRRYDQDRPGAAGIETIWKRENSAARIGSRIASLRRNILKVGRHRKTDFNFAAGLNRLTGKSSRG